jgi:hypothetical protein
MTRITITDPADWRPGDHARVEWTAVDGITHHTIDGPIYSGTFYPEDLLCGGAVIRCEGWPTDSRTFTVTREVPDEDAP